MCEANHIYHHVKGLNENLCVIDRPYGCFLCIADIGGNTGLPVGTHEGHCPSKEEDAQLEKDEEKNREERCAKLREECKGADSPICYLHMSDCSL